MSRGLYPVPSRHFAVPLGELTFYATQWRLTAQRQYVQQGGATGGTFLTNSSRRAKVLTLTGYFSFTTSPAQVVVPLENALANGTRYSFTLHGMDLITVFLTGYAIEETATQGVLACTLTMLTTGNITANTGQETEGGT